MLKIEQNWGKIANYPTQCSTKIGTPGGKGLGHLFITSSSSRFFNKTYFEQYFFNNFYIGMAAFSPRTKLVLKINKRYSCTVR